VLSVVIPAMNDASGLSRTLAAVFPGMTDGLVRQVIVADGGSTDSTAALAGDAGVELVQSQPGRGHQLKLGAEAARHPWLLFLHAGTVLDEGWHRHAARFIAMVNDGTRPLAASAFRYGVDDTGVRPRLIEYAVSIWCTVTKLPFGEQGLLIPRLLYDRAGGYQPLPAMEDVDLVRRLSRSERAMFSSRAVIDAVDYQRDGYLARSGHRAVRLTKYFAQTTAHERVNG
jgi:glycosyltransferase involved in cell wall biosynthesis